MVWDRNLYKQEAERQLSDSTFFERLDRDFTVDYNKTVCEVVKEAITKGEFQHQPSILSWKIFARLDFISCRKSTRPETLEDLLFPPVTAEQS